jgi:hypothetical protein
MPLALEVLQKSLANFVSSHKKVVSKQQTVSGKQ